MPNALFRIFLLRSTSNANLHFHFRFSCISYFLSNTFIACFAANTLIDFLDTNMSSEPVHVKINVGSHFIRYTATPTFDKFWELEGKVSCMWKISVICLFLAPWPSNENACVLPWSWRSLLRDKREEGLWGRARTRRELYYHLSDACACCSLLPSCLLSSNIKCLKVVPNLFGLIVYLFDGSYNLKCK